MIEVVCCVVKELGADVNQTDKRGYTPLGIAAYHGNVEMVRCLVTDLGADVNQADNRESHTPFMTAALRAHTDVLKVLVELGADSNLVEEAALTASSLAAQDGLLDVVTFLKDLNIDVSQAGTDGDVPSLAPTPAEDKE
jgi:ankyrin repeat protein